MKSSTKKSPQSSPKRTKPATKIEQNIPESKENPEDPPVELFQEILPTLPGDLDEVGDVSDPNLNFTPFDSPKRRITRKERSASRNSDTSFISHTSVCLTERVSR